MTTALSTVIVDGWTLATDGEEPRVRDTDLAERLGYAQPRDIRKLVRRMIESSEISDVCERATVARSGFTERNVSEFWLTEEQALLVAARSDTTLAVDVRRALVRVFIAARRGLLAPAPQVDTLALARDVAREVVSVVLAEMRALPAPAVLAVPPEDVEAMIVSAGERFLISADPKKPIGEALAASLAARMRRLGRRLAQHLHPNDPQEQKRKARRLISRAQFDLRQTLKCGGESYAEIPTAYARGFVAWIDAWEAQIDREHGGDPGAGPLFDKAS